MSARKRPWIKSVFNEIENHKIAVMEETTKQEEVNEKRPRTNNEKERTPLVIQEQPNSKTNVAWSDWLEQFTPKSIDDLAVHTKKIEEFQDWLQNRERKKDDKKSNICVVTGPTGSGKTATVRSVAEKNGYQLQEWINPVDTDVINTLGDQEQGSNYSSIQFEAFKGFLFRASRYKSVINQCNKRLLLVEDFPNILLLNISLFENILDDYTSFGISPLVFIVADSRSRGLNISYNLFSEQIKSKYKIIQIAFNPIAATLMTKAMKRFCTIIRQAEAGVYSVPTQDIVDSIVVSVQGDIRNALINLHFSALNGSMPVAIKRVEQTKHQNRKKKSALKSIGRDESITMLHTLGRVLNPKFTSDGKLTYSPEEISECFSNEPQKFVDLLHGNYLPHFSNIENVAEAIDYLSSADLLLHEYRDSTLPTIGLNLSVRGLMCSNEKPVTGWMPIGATKRLHNSKQAQNSTNFEQLKQFVSANLYASEFDTYVRRILVNV